MTPRFKQVVGTLGAVMTAPGVLLALVIFEEALLAGTVALACALVCGWCAVVAVEGFEDA